ncbi:MAG: putative addiction module antidote protein [Magnetococcales bacterium]|nr:putative addiction module antidote protein [Magnetococcales bacterium]
MGIKHEKNKIKTSIYNTIEYLDSDQAINAYMEEALATGDPSFIAKALGTITHARCMTQIAKKAGLSRENLCKTLSPDGNPEFSMVLRVMHALDLKFSITASSHSAEHR